ncbi:MAG: inositol monophosphatase family protein, partial [Planctomycetota bacterium]
MLMNRNNLKPYLEIAQKAALQAGVVLKEHFGKVSPSMISEKATNDYVTDVDKKSEAIIKNLLRSHFKDHDILAEESTPERSSSSPSRPYWLEE